MSAFLRAAQPFLTALKMEAASSSETLVPIYQSIRCRTHTREDYDVCRKRFWNNWQLPTSLLTDWQSVKWPPFLHKSWCQNCDINQVRHWGLAVLEWHLNVTVVWCLLLGACVLIRTVCVRQKTAVIMLKMLSSYKISCPDYHASRVCAPLQ
jgi:hypothetical protein